MSRYSPPLSLALGLAAALLLAGCPAGGPRPSVKAAPSSQPLVVAPGQAVRPLALTAFRLDIPPGQHLEHVQAGAACLPATKSKEQGTLDSPEMQQLVLAYVAESFEEQGYHIDRGGQAALTLSPAITALTASMCYPWTSIGDQWTGLGQVWMTLRWVVATRDGTVLLDRSTEGSARSDSSQQNVRAVLMQRVIEQAAANVMADPALAALLVGDGNPDTAPVAMPLPAPAGPSSLSPKALAGAQSAFDRWLADNHASLAAALESHHAALGQPLTGGVPAFEAAQVQDLTEQGFVVRLTFANAGASQSGLYLVTLNEGRLQRVSLMT